jgi:hypothetical protein
MKRLLEKRDGPLRLHATTHEDVYSGILMLGPCVDADMGFGEDCYAGHATAPREAMNINV